MKIGEVEYTKLTDDFGYWTVKVEDIGTYLPIKLAHEPGKRNPFIGWKIADDVEKFIENTVREIAIPDGVDISRSIPWGNYFDRSRFAYHKFHHLPHVDFPGWVGNLWLSQHPKGSRGTQFYNYKDEWKSDLFNFTGPTELLNELETDWKQWDISKVESYGFEYMGTAPAEKNTMTIYNSCVPHKAYIGDEVDRSWSQLVQLSKRRHFTSSDDVVGVTNLNSNVFNLKNE